jgi:hypothetical protein
MHTINYEKPPKLLHRPGTRTVEAAVSRGIDIRIGYGHSDRAEQRYDVGSVLLL